MLRIKDTPYKMVLLTEGEFYQNIFLFLYGHLHCLCNLAIFKKLKEQLYYCLEGQESALTDKQWYGDSKLLDVY